MSRDQKPAKIRVIAGAQPALPRRRAVDREAEAPTDAALASTAPDELRLPLLSLLYLSACAFGGVGVALLLRTIAA